MKSIIVGIFVLLFVSLAVVGQVEAQAPAAVDSVKLAEWEELAKASGMPDAFKGLKGQIAAIKGARPTGYYTSRAMGEFAQQLADEMAFQAVKGDTTSPVWIAYRQGRHCSKARKAAGAHAVEALWKGAKAGLEAQRTLAAFEERIVKLQERIVELEGQLAEVAQNAAVAKEAGLMALEFIGIHANKDKDRGVADEARRTLQEIAPAGQEIPSLKGIPVR